MNYADIKEKDTINGVGFGVSLFVSGCRNHCKGCFNPETWDFTFGRQFTDDVLYRLVDLVARPYVDFFSVLGGEPFEPENTAAVFKIVSKVREVCPSVVINIWSGYDFEYLIKNDTCKSILGYCDNLVDGKFNEDLYNYKLIMRGSSNQRIIAVKESLLKGCVVLNDSLMNL